MGKGKEYDNQSPFSAPQHIEGEEENQLLSVK
jgi:hypothetical protein